MTSLTWPQDKDVRNREQLRGHHVFSGIYMEAHNRQTARSDSNAQDAYAVAVMHDTGTQLAMTWIIIFNSLYASVHRL